MTSSGQVYTKKVGEPLEVQVIKNNDFNIQGEIEISKDSKLISRSLTTYFLIIVSIFLFEIKINYIIDTKNQDLAPLAKFFFFLLISNFIFFLIYFIRDFRKNKSGITNLKIREEYLNLKLSVLQEKIADLKTHIKNKLITVINSVENIEIILDKIITSSNFMNNYHKGNYNDKMITEINKKLKLKDLKTISFDTSSTSNTLRVNDLINQLKTLVIEKKKHKHEISNIDIITYEKNIIFLGLNFIYPIVITVFALYFITLKELSINWFVFLNSFLISLAYYFLLSLNIIDILLSRINGFKKQIKQNKIKKLESRAKKLKG